MADTISLAFHVINFVIVAAAIILNSFGIYLLASDKLVGSNQCIILIHLSCIKVIICLTEAVISTLELLDRADGFREYQVIDTINAGLYGINDLIVIVLTTDRLAAALRPLKYNVHVTKNKLNVAALYCWVIGTCGIIPFFFLEYDMLYEIFYKIVFSSLDAIVLSTALLTYGIILRKLLSRHKALAEISKRDSRASTRSPRGHFRFFYITGLIIASFILFVTIPDAVYINLVIIQGNESPIIERTVGFVWSLYLVADPLIYIFLQRSVKNRLKSVLFRRRVDVVSQSRNIALVST